jgi:hypothetical protein
MCSTCEVPYMGVRRMRPAPALRVPKRQCCLGACHHQGTQAPRLPPSVRQHASGGSTGVLRCGNMCVSACSTAHMEPHPLACVVERAPLQQAVHAKAGGRRAEQRRRQPRHHKSRFEKLLRSRHGSGGPAAACWLHRPLHLHQQHGCCGQSGKSCVRRTCPYASAWSLMGAGSGCGCAGGTVALQQVGNIAYSRRKVG